MQRRGETRGDEGSGASGGPSGVGGRTGEKTLAAQQSASSAAPPPPLWPIDAARRGRTALTEGTKPRGCAMPCQMGYRVGWDTVSDGIPCQVDKVCAHARVWASA
jgi:hypothetical protein